MKLYFKQRFFSWFDSYDIYDETGSPVYIVKGQLAWGHLSLIHICGAHHADTMEERPDPCGSILRQRYIPDRSGDDRGEYWRTFNFGVQIGF